MHRGEVKEIAIVCVGRLGNAAFSLLGRRVARRGSVDTILLTAIPLVVGAVTLLPLALFFEGRQLVTTKGLSPLALLCTLNMALVYSLYNRVLLSVKAFNISSVLNLVPLFTAVWSWIIVAERLAIWRFIGIGLVILGSAFALEEGT